jgi:hypothetical protein
MRRFTGFATATAIVITTVGLSATPAEARQRHGGWGYRHHDRIDAGDVIGGLLGLGTIAAIASAASKNKAERRSDRYDPPYREDDDRDARYDSRDRDDDDAGSYGSADDAAPGSQRADVEVRPYGTGADEQRAADACSWAVEGDMGRDSRVDSVDKTEPNNGGWYVTGTASRLGGEVKSFGCSYQNGRVVDIRFGE